ncbi:Alpha/Beta hydrolase protein [Obelidium mucronatum]|nr:Alpha/Beta hydrolase protein [Obelidium mucronatum]
MTTVSTAPSCCSLAPVTSNYTSKGEVITVGDLKVYIVGEKGAKNAIIINYDIFGDMVNTRQVADLLASQGFRVAMPDLCKGDPWPASVWPPTNGFGEVMAHIQKNASFPSVERDMKATQQHLISEGSQYFGLIGFCWGGVMVALLSQDVSYQAGAIIHPGGFSLEDAAKVAGPLLILPAQDDSAETFDAIFKVVSEKNPASKMRRFDDVPHGFCASRSDFGDPLRAQRANEAIAEVNSFFKANLGPKQ